jgi:hypothetical protein
MTPEGKVKSELDVYLDSLGRACFYFKPMNFGYGKNGIPDYIICYKGFFLAPETKRAKGGKSQPWQERRQMEINKAQGYSARITDIEIVKNWIAECDLKYDCLGAAGLF